MPPAPHPVARTLCRLLLAALAALSLPAAGLQALPPRLSDTGLFMPGQPAQLRPGVVAFAPQYPLWSDGARKQRWMALPRGGAIDASNPDAWQFPKGTRLWKSFAVDGRPVETRYIERRADGGWSFASYVWDEAGTEATLAPEQGIAAWPVPGAPNGRYTVPGRGDCLACHGGAPVPVLGFSALQLADALPALVALGRLRGLPPALLVQPPRIAADTPTERAALGTLHANCGHCHHRMGGQVPLALTLAQRVAAPQASRAEVLQSAVGAASRFRAPGLPAGAFVIAPGQPQMSVLVQRMQSRQPLVQMPPLGTQVPDPEGLALIERWISQDLSPRKEH